jgi:hypothetical protein
MSVNSKGSTLPSAQSARANTPTSGTICCSGLSPTGPAGVATYQSGVRDAIGRRGKIESVVVTAHAAPTQEARHDELTRLPPQIVAVLDLAEPLKLLERRIKIRIVGHDGEIAEASAQRPRSLIPYRRGPIGVSPGVGGIVESTGIDQRPVQKITARLVRVFIGIEPVPYREFSNREDNPIGGLRPGKLVGVGRYLLGLAREIDGLSDEQARQAQIRIVGADLVGFAVGESGDAVCLRPSEALVDLRVQANPPLT